MISHATNDAPLISPPSHEERQWFSLISDTASVTDSQIHGKGLFASRNLHIGETILRMNFDDFSARERHPWNGKNRDILPFFVNHSCGPNACLAASLVDQAMLLKAIRSIKKGEEVTLDYFLVEIGGTFLPCLCGSVGCRGVFPALVRDRLR